MLPALARMFALVRDLSSRREVTEIPASRWLIQRHNLGALTALAGVSQLRDELAVATVRWIALSREIPVLVARMVDAGIGIAPIKGLAYAAALYQVPAARPMTDVDLLVEPGADARARDVLVRAGFALKFDVALHHASTWERGGLTIDLHRNIMPAGRSQISLPEVWARTRPGWPDGARRLEPVDELVFHLAHMTRNRLCGTLVQVVDAARLIERVDSLDEVMERAARWRIDAAIGVALAYCRAILNRSPTPWLAPADADVLLVHQPRAARKVVFDVATAGSVQQLAARVFAVGAQWVTRGLPSGDRRGR